jgi:hypothetical protein
MNIPESRSVRVTRRGKEQTSRYRAEKVAERTLVVRRVEPRPVDPSARIRIAEEVTARGFKLKRPSWLVELDRRPFQSMEQHLEATEIRLQQQHPER